MIRRARGESCPKTITGALPSSKKRERKDRGLKEEKTHKEEIGSRNKERGVTLPIPNSAFWGGEK